LPAYSRSFDLAFRNAGERFSEVMNNLPKGNQEGGRQLIPVGEAVPALRDPYGRLALYGVSLGDESEESGSKLREYLRIVNKRKWLILAIAAAFVVIGTVRMLMQTPLYVSAVRLQIEREARVVESGNVEPSYSDNEFMQTQIQLLEGRAMAERVVSALKLGDDSDFLRPRGFSFMGTLAGLIGRGPSTSDEAVDETAREDLAAGIASGNLAVSPVPNSRLIDVSFTDTDPGRAQRIANSFADAFIATTIDKRFQANQAAKVFLEDKIKQLKQRVEDSEKALVDLAQKQQIIAVDVEARTSSAESNLASANTELATLTSERTKNEELWRQAERANDINLPQLLSDAAVADLLKQRTDLTIDYQQKLKTFKPAYPAMVDLSTKIEEINRQLADKVSTLKQSLKAAYETSLVRETEARTSVDQIKKELLQLQKQSVQYNMAKREVDTNRELYTSLLQRYKEVDVASGATANNVFIAEKAMLGAPSSESLLRSLLKALALGLGLGVVVAMLLEYLDDKIRTAEQVESITGLSVLGAVPKVRRVENQLTDPRSPLSEAHRSLCTALQFTTESGMPKVLAITSAGPGEGKSLTANAIARHFASLGRKVLLIDADLRNPSQHVKLGCGNSVGLSNYLTGACTPPEAMQKTEIPTLAFIASGPLPPNAADLLGGARLISLLSIGSEVFDLIIVDGPPVLGLADAQLLSSAASATLFVVGAGTTRKALVRGSLRRLQLSRGSLIGAVLTKYDAKIGGYEYAYGYGYGYSYGSDKGVELDPRGLTVQSISGGKPQPQLTSTSESV
jgi:capsular exopolysaccharide synthesis family protein